MNFTKRTEFIVQSKYTISPLIPTVFAEKDILGLFLETNHYYCST